ncbi:MAG: CarD family transcriptional regulator [Bacillota bacterium]
MFKIGDKVVYPMHGAGIIEAIEDREFMGCVQSYYVMKLPFGGMKVMIPLNNVENIGLRQVVGMTEINKVFNILKDRKKTAATTWNRRVKAHMDKMKSGDIYEVAEVVRNLALQDREKRLSTGERRLLENARQILISELVLAQDIEEQSAALQISEMLK